MNNIPRKPNLYNFITQSNHFIIIPSISKVQYKAISHGILIEKKILRKHTDLDMTESCSFLCIFFIVPFSAKPS